jgi:DNA-binding PadR family transcriptional regulator
LEVGPLHPYGLQQLIKSWGKDQVVNVGNRANLYKTIGRLTDAGLIAVRTTEREQLYPERTVYQLTDAGRQESVRWLEVMLATARNEFPEFPAALSFAMLLAPRTVESALRRRADQVRANLEKLDQTLRDLAGLLPRITLIETEYQKTITAAELVWLETTADELASGTLDWSGELLRQAASANSDTDRPIAPPGEITPTPLP